MEAFEVDARTLKVCIGMPSGPFLPVQTVVALAHTAYAAARSGLDLTIDVTAGSSIITNARNLVANNFLEGGASTLVWIDSDIVWKPADFFRLVGLATQKDVVCGTYPLKRDEIAFVVNHPDAKTFEMDQFGLLKIKGAGLGFTAVSRRALEALAATKGDIVHQHGGDRRMKDLFRLGKDENDNLQGEDMSFFFDLAALGYDCWLDPTLKLGHVGLKEYRGDPVEAFGLGEVYRG